MTCSQLLPWNKLKLLLLTRLLIIPVVDGFCPHFTRPLEITKESFLEGRLSSLTRCFEALSPISESTEKKPCFWRPKPRGSRWKERINIKDLKVGQKLAGSVVNELLEGKTGPKVYFECGVGRTDKKGEWNIVHGMLRLDRSKTSVARKRAARLKKKDEVELYVSRVQLECGRLEVCLLPEEVEKYQGKPKIPVSSLQVGQVVEGRVFKLRPYGVIVDIGANRNALLHIRKVAKLYGKYIDEEKGLYEAGLERGARVRLAIESMDDKRLFLDFTEETKASSVPDQESSSESTATATQNNQVMPDEELDEMAVSAEESSKQSSVKIESKTEGTTAPSQNDQGVSKEELSAWAEYANQSENSDEADDDDDDDYDDYDEQRDIEDSLGLGFY